MCVGEFRKVIEAAPMHSHLPHEKGHSRRSQVACELVGVAGFEPAASSSRSQVAGPSPWGNGSGGLLVLSTYVR
jgi:hypothetical protein